MATRPKYNGHQWSTSSISRCLSSSQKGSPESPEPMLCFNALRPERKPSFAIPNRSWRTSEDFDLFNMFQLFNIFWGVPRGVPRGLESSDPDFGSCA